MKNALFVIVLLLLCASANAAMVVGYDASAVSGDPTAIGWTRYGIPMTDMGNYLLQDNTADEPVAESGEYLAPATPGLMKFKVSNYGVEVKVRPLTDVPFLGGSVYGNAYVWWADDTFCYNITIDKYTNDLFGTGGIKYGQNSLSDAVVGIDWSVAHTIYVGYRGTAGQYGLFDFYVDGQLASTVDCGSIARGGSWARDAVDFGDGTTATGDVAVEWYTVKLYDSAAPPIPEPTTISLISLGLLALRRK